MSSLSVTNSDIGEISPTGWLPREALPFSVWETAMVGFIDIKGSINWLIGDGMNYGELTYGETYAQAIEATGWEYQHIADAKWVAGAVPMENRRDTLTWTHHKIIAPLSEEAQRYWLGVAEGEALSTSDLRSRIAGKKVKDEPLVIEVKSRDAQALFMEAASIVATEGDMVTWGEALSKEELKEAFVYVYFMANTLANAVDHIYGRIERTDGYRGDTGSDEDESENGYRREEHYKDGDFTIAGDSAASGMAMLEDGRAVRV